MAQGIQASQQGMTTATTANARRAYQLLLGFHLYLVNDQLGAIAVYDQVDWSAEMDTTGQDAGTSIMAQRLDWQRGRVVYGCCLELVGRTDEAIECFASSITMFADISGISLPLADSFLVLAPPSLKPTSTTKVLPPPLRPTSQRNTATFESHREAHRWAALALTRGTILSARTSNLERTLQFARTYHIVSRMWPCSFQSSQQILMLDMYLRALEIDVPAPPLAGQGIEPGYQWLICEIPHSISSHVTGTRFQLWQREWLNTMDEGKKLLSVSTRFPASGQTNEPVEQFVERCVGLWEITRSVPLSGDISSGRSVVNILWWAIEMTFHSQLVLRHLTRLLIATGRVSDAKRVFEIYTRLVLKARQTARPDEGLELPSVGTHEPVSESKQDPQGGVGVQTTEQLRQGSEVEYERDGPFVSTLVAGAKLLVNCDPAQAWRYALLAGNVISLHTPDDDNGDPIPPSVRADVEQIKGTIQMTLALDELDHRGQLTSTHHQALTHLHRAVDLNSNDPGTRYSLAHALALTRDIQGALDVIRGTLELVPTNVQAWHLLALLLSATNEWAAARKAAVTGIDLWDAQEMKKGQIANSAVEPVVGVESRDFAQSRTEETIRTDETIVPAPQRQPLIQGEALTTVAPLQAPATNTTTATTCLAQIIQLRMTLAVIVEKLEGPEEAMQVQQETFSLFSSFGGATAESGGMLVEDGAGSVMGGSNELGESFITVTEPSSPVEPLHGQSPSRLSE